MAPSVFFYARVDRLTTAAGGRRRYRTWSTICTWRHSSSLNNANHLKSLSQNRFKCIIVLAFRLFSSTQWCTSLFYLKSPFNSFISTARFNIFNKEAQMFHQPTRSATKFTKMYTRIFTRHRALRKFGRNSFYSYTQMFLYRNVEVSLLLHLLFSVSSGTNLWCQINAT